MCFCYIRFITHTHALTSHARTNTHIHKKKNCLDVVLIFCVCDECLKKKKKNKKNIYECIEAGFWVCLCLLSRFRQNLKYRFVSCRNEKNFGFFVFVLIFFFSLLNRKKVVCVAFFFFFNFDSFSLKSKMFSSRNQIQ